MGAELGGDELADQGLKIRRRGLGVRGEGPGEAPLAALDDGVAEKAPRAVLLKIYQIFFLAPWARPCLAWADRGGADEGRSEKKPGEGEKAC